MKFTGIADEAGKAITTQVKAHRELSWTDIEIRCVDSGANLTAVSDAEFETVYNAVTAAGMSVLSFASALCNWSRPITNDFQVDIDELKRAIPRMHRFGTKFIRIMSYPNAKDNPWPDMQWRDEAVRRISELARMAAGGGVILAHENCDGWAGHGPEATLCLLEKVNSPALKLIFDTGNPVAHKQDAWDYYAGVRDQVVHVHIKDGVNEAAGHRHTYPGEGEGYVKKIVADLKKRGYDGYLSIEPHLASVIHLAQNANDPDAAYKAYIKYGRMTMAIAADKAPAKAVAKAKPKAKPKAQPKVKPKSKPKVQPKAKPKAKPKPRTKAKTKAKRG